MTSISTSELESSAATSIFSLVVVRRSIHLVVLPFLLLQLFFSRPVQAECTEVAWDEAPTWLTSGSWVDPTTLLVADAGVGQGILYNLNLESAGTSALERLRPIDTGNLNRVIEIQESSMGYWIRGLDGMMLFMDKSLTPKLDLNLVGVRDAKARGAQLPDNTTDTLQSVVQWAPAPDGSLVVFGDIDRGGTNYETAFVAVSPFSAAEEVGGKVSSFTSKLVRGFRDGAEGYYFFQYPYISSNSKYTYALVLDELPSIVRLTDTGYYSEVWQAGRLFRSGFLDDSIRPSPDQFADFFAQTRDANLPVGIFGREDAVYVLQKRSHSVQAHERWILDRFPIGYDGSLDTSEPQNAYLPIKDSTEHVTLIPGKRHWLVVEKSAMETAGRATLNRTWMFDTADLFNHLWASREPSRFCANGL